MAAATDLDILVPESKIAKLGGVEYRLPGDLPMDIYLRMNRAGDLQDESESKALEGILDAVCDLFAWEVVETDAAARVRERVRAILGRRGVSFLMDVVKNLYREDDEEEAKADEAPPTEQTSGETPPPTPQPQQAPASVS